MMVEKVTDVPKIDDATNAAFAEFPRVPVASTLRPPSNAWRARIVFGCVVAGVVMMLAVYLTRPTTVVDPNAPRVVVEVSGMHCPIQCGLRVASSLKQLPFVLPDSVTANPKTGIVTFAATSAEAVDQDQVRRAIEKAGFGVRSIQMPSTSERVDGLAESSEINKFADGN